MLFCSLAAGKAFDWWSKKQVDRKEGGENVVWMGLPIAAGGLVSFVGLFLLSYVEIVEVAFFLSMLVGAGASLFAIPSITIVQSWYGERTRAKATGLAMAGSGLGNFVYAIGLQKLISHFDGEGGGGEGGGGEGWRKALRVEAGVSLGLVFFGSTLIFRKMEEKRGGNGDSGANQLTFIECMRTRPLLTVTAFKAIFAFGYLNFFVHIVAFCEGIGLSTEDSSLALSLVGICSIVGRVVIGIAADKAGTKNCLLVSMVILAGCVGLWPQVKATSEGKVHVMVLSGCYGFFAGAFPSLPPSIVAEYYIKVANNSLFQIVGVQFFLETLGALVGPVLVGKLFDTTGDYEAGAWMTFGVMVVGIGVLASINNVKNFERKLAEGGIKVRTTSDDGSNAIL
jgi:MFS family permease